MTPKPLYICSRPFKWFEIAPDGRVFLCCPTWLNKPVGNILFQSAEEIWNGKAAREIRKTMLDGSFRYCNNLLCPNLQNKSNSVFLQSEVTDSDLKHAMRCRTTIVKHGPRTINCSFDRSCNLSCPSCREHTIITMGKDKSLVLKIIDAIQKDLAKDIHELYVTGSGDPFGSPSFFQWLQHMKTSDYPKLKNVHLHTNGQLFTPKTWGMISGINNKIKTVEISIDAASPETYGINRRGGSFPRLLENLAFIGSLRKANKLRFVTISFVVQENNFREMPDFVRLRDRFGFDHAYFSQLVNWGTFTPQEYLKRAVHLPGHPKHQEFLSIIKKIAFSVDTLPTNTTNIPFSKEKYNGIFVNYVSKAEVPEKSSFVFIKKFEILSHYLYNLRNESNS